MPGHLKPGLQGNCHIPLACYSTHFCLVTSRSAGLQALLGPGYTGKEVRPTRPLTAQKNSLLHQLCHGKYLCI